MKFTYKAGDVEITIEIDKEIATTYNQQKLISDLFENIIQKLNNE